MLSMDKVSKKKFGRITEYFCAKNLTSGFVEERVRARIDQSENESVPSQCASIGTLAARASLGKNVSKEVCFLVVREDNLVQLPKEPTVTWTVDIVCFSGAAMEFLKCFCWRTFYKQGPIRRWICTSFNTERWSGPSYKRSRSWFRTADGKWNGIKCLFCWRSEQVLVTL